MYLLRKVTMNINYFYQRFYTMKAYVLTFLLLLFPLSAVFSENAESSDDSEYLNGIMINLISDLSDEMMASLLGELVRVPDVDHAIIHAPSIPLSPEFSMSISDSTVDLMVCTPPVDFSAPFSADREFVEDFILYNCLDVYREVEGLTRDLFMSMTFQEEEQILNQMCHCFVGQEGIVSESVEEQFLEAFDIMLQEIGSFESSNVDAQFEFLDELSIRISIEMDNISNSNQTNKESRRRGASRGQEARTVGFSRYFLEHAGINLANYCAPGLQEYRDCAAFSPYQDLMNSFSANGIDFSSIASQWLDQQDQEELARAFIDDFSSVALADSSSDQVSDFNLALLSLYNETVSVYYIEAFLDDLIDRDELDHLMFEVMSEDHIRENLRARFKDLPLEYIQLGVDFVQELTRERIDRIDSYEEERKRDIRRHLPQIIEMPAAQSEDDESSILDLLLSQVAASMSAIHIMGRDIAPSMCEFFEDHARHICSEQENPIPSYRNYFQQIGLYDNPFHYSMMMCGFRHFAELSSPRELIDSGEDSEILLNNYLGQRTSIRQRQGLMSEEVHTTIEIDDYVREREEGDTEDGGYFAIVAPVSDDSTSSYSFFSSKSSSSGRSSDDNLTIDVKSSYRTSYGPEPAPGVMPARSESDSTSARVARVETENSALNSFFQNSLDQQQSNPHGPFRHLAPPPQQAQSTVVQDSGEAREADPRGLDRMQEILDRYERQISSREERLEEASQSGDPDAPELQRLREELNMLRSSMESLEQEREQLQSRLERVEQSGALEEEDSYQRAESTQSVFGARSSRGPAAIREGVRAPASHAPQAVTTLTPQVASPSSAAPAAMAHSAAYFQPTSGISSTPVLLSMRQRSDRTAVRELGGPIDSSRFQELSENEDFFRTFYEEHGALQPIVVREQDENGEISYIYLFPEVDGDVVEYVRVEEELLEQSIESLDQEIAEQLVDEREQVEHIVERSVSRHADLVALFEEFPEN